MGGVPSKTKKQIDIESLPKVEPEPDYVVKTRSPMPGTLKPFSYWIVD